jgi:hypothetical protein
LAKRTTINTIINQIGTLIVKMFKKYVGRGQIDVNNRKWAPSISSVLLQQLADGVALNQVAFALFVFFPSIYRQKLSLRPKNGLQFHQKYAQIGHIPSAFVPIAQQPGQSSTAQGQRASACKGTWQSPVWMDCVELIKLFLFSQFLPAAPVGPARHGPVNLARIPMNLILSPGAPGTAGAVRLGQGNFG